MFQQHQKALAKVEDDIDVQAAKELKAEVHADIAEFDENNIEMAENENGYNADEINDDPMRRQLIDMNRLESEFKSIETEVSQTIIIYDYDLKYLNLNLHKVKANRTLCSQISRILRQHRNDRRGKRGKYNLFICCCYFF